MSLRTIGFDANGRAIRVDEGPAYAGSIRFGGEIVRGESGAVEQSRLAKKVSRDGLRGEKLLQARANKTARFVAGKDAA